MIGVKIAVRGTLESKALGYDLPPYLIETISVSLSCFSLNKAVIEFERNVNYESVSVMKLLGKLPNALADQLTPPAVFVLVAYLTDEMFICFVVFLVYYFVVCLLNMVCSTAALNDIESSKPTRVWIVLSV